MRGQETDLSCQFSKIFCKNSFSNIRAIQSWLLQERLFVVFTDLLTMKLDKNFAGTDRLRTLKSLTKFSYQILQTAGSIRHEVVHDLTLNSRNSIQRVDD